MIPDGKPAVRPHFDRNFGSFDTRAQALACVDVAKRAGLDFLVLDQTRPDIETPVVRVIVPACAISIAVSGPAGFTTCR